MKIDTTKETNKNIRVAKKFAKGLAMLSEALIKIDFIKSVNLYKNEYGEVELDIEQYEDKGE